MDRELPSRTGDILLAEYFRIYAPSLRNPSLQRDHRASILGLRLEHEGKKRAARGRRKT